MLNTMPDFLIWMSIFVAFAVIALALTKIIIVLIKGDRKQKIFNLISIACVLIMIVSWFMNFGWFRFALTIMPLPLVHIAAFLIIINLSMKRGGKKTYIAAVLTHITFLMTYLLFPDGGDIGGMYVFFGQIHNDDIATTCFLIASYSLVVNIALLVTLFVMGFRAKKKMKAESEIKTEISEEA